MPRRSQPTSAALPVRGRVRCAELDVGSHTADLAPPTFRPYGQTEELLESGILRDEGEDEVAAQDQPIAGQQPKRQLVLDKAHAKVIHDRAKFVPLPTFERTDGTTCIRLSAEPHAAAPCTHW